MFLTTTFPYWMCSHVHGNNVSDKDNELEIMFNFSDISISVVESAVQTKLFILQFLTEFYDQLTSISWLSVRSVQRSSKSSSNTEQIEEGRGYFNIIEGFYDYLSSSSSSIISGDDAWTDPEVVTVSKAEERIKLAEEIALNNTFARQRLGLTKIIR